MELRKSIFLIVWLVGTASCSSTSSTINVLSKDAGQIDAATACYDFARANCIKRQACTNLVQAQGTQIMVQFGDIATCEEREKLACLGAVRAKNTGYTATQAELCAQAHADWSCSDFLDNVPPANCRPTGNRANAAPCTFNGQCVSGYCADNRRSNCGICADVPPPAAECDRSNCGYSELCVDGVCRTRGGLQMNCDNTTAPCEAGLSCTGPSNGTKTCQTAITTAFASCGASAPGCYFVQGYWCSGTSPDKTCQPINYVEGGEPCGTQSDGTQAACIAGNCFTSAGPAELTDLGTCMANAGDGEPCDVQLGPTCITPARCVTDDGGASGTCRVPDDSNCG